MTDKENITAILECYFSGFKKEIIDSACSRILELKHHINVDVLVPKMQELNQIGIFNKGYEKGYNEGMASHDSEGGRIYYGGYADGLDDAWECIKKIYNMDFKTRKEILGVDAGHDTLVDIVKTFSADEVIDKIKRFDNEIKVGDEVMDGEVFNSGKGIVTFISPILLYVLWYDGSTGRRKLTDVKKTGRTFSKIAEFLEQLKEEEK